VQGSAAKQKRRPFVVRNGERTHNVYCCQHADELATFYCAICHKPYGEEQGNRIKITSVSLRF